MVWTASPDIVGGAFVLALQPAEMLQKKTGACSWAANGNMRKNNELHRNKNETTKTVGLSRYNTGEPTAQ